MQNKIRQQIKIKDIYKYKDDKTKYEVTFNNKRFKTKQTLDLKHNHDI